MRSVRRNSDERRARRSLVRPASVVAISRSRARQVDRETERALVTERARFAHAIDVELRVACRSEAAARLELGLVARQLLRRRAYRRLGFVRLADYARERLGLSARTLQAAAWVATRLDELPAIAAAFDRSDLSWAEVRALCALASPEDQDAWLARARQSTVEALEQAAAARHEGANADPDADDGTIDGEPVVRVRIACPSRVRALWRRALELASRAAGEPLPLWRAAECIAAEAFSGRPEDVPFIDRMILVGSRLARRMRRERVPVAPAAPAVPAMRPAAATAGAATAAGAAPGVGRSTPLHADAVFSSITRAVGTPPAPPSGARSPGTPAPSADAFALDQRALAAVQTIRTCEPRIGRLLRIIVDQRVHRAHGFDSLAAYARERLGLSARKAWALLKIERGTRRGDAFARAYESGTLSWVQALTLLPVVDRRNAAAWIARAEAVTVRRLADEVSWVLERHDLAAGRGTLDPPPLDSVLASPAMPVALAGSRSGAVGSGAGAEGSDAAGGSDVAPAAGVQIRAQEDRAAPGSGVAAAVPNFDTDVRAWLEVADAEVRFSAPASVVALFREALDVFSRPGAPRWLALEGMLRHVIVYWESTPRHRDPIFERDGWRCAVPGCSSRRNLHDHHLQFRSRGGGNARENRVTVCVAHHLHGIHEGVVRASGFAPRDVRWELGVRADGPPLLTFVGDRRCSDTKELAATRP